VPVMIDDTQDHVNEVKRLFNTRAATWSALYAPGGSFIGRLTLFSGILDQNVPAGGQVLDLGCGTGEIACAAAAAGLRVTGCDISELMLSSAISQDPRGTVEWVLLDSRWRRLPFSAGTFDAVVAASVLEYIDEPRVVLSECARVLRPGGLLACTVPDPRHPIRWLESLAAVGARRPTASIASYRWPRAENYFTYLQTSRQRHMASWWRGAAEGAGLHPVPCSAHTSRYSRLRLFTFERPHQAGEHS
jgi:SAM-dependent methyltransferase